MAAFIPIMTPKTTFRHRLEAILIWVLPYALRPLPFALRVKAGGMIIGPILRVLPPTRKRLSDNLDLIYPNISKSEKRKFMGRICKNIGARFIEGFYNAEFHQQTHRFHVADGALDQIKKAKAMGRPIILVSGHFGQWEAPRAVMMAAGMESGAIYRKSHNPVFERHFFKSVSAGGKPLFQSGRAGVRGMVKHLKSGGVFAILLDQVSLSGEMLEFLGKPAFTALSSAELALKFNALLVPCYGIIRENGRDIDVVFEPAIPHSDAKTMTQALNDSLGARVKTNPDQWYWLHRRWKTPK